ncbi:MFS transporter [Sporolactobacillus shoreicorticis]|uniref:MFS transporter n=1 Tax=Sporolactobacillus shoreicorticis TaxID=1923877 RepID=A0ABW5S0S7_9BACL|nr:MFS transporter [Sporolactobacillus shoreicorticis]MCO7124723.1 MFS transporter [Sporolactobacillus shoreicorticis]
MAEKIRQIKWRNIIGYGAADVFGNGALAVVSTWMLFFYTTFCGLSPIEAGSILAIARVVDSFISPVMGNITDHFGSTRLGKRFGRRRFFLLLACPLMIFYVLLWVTGLNYWYYLITYIIIETLTAIVMIPYETLASEMTNDYSERTKMTSSRMLWAAVATLLTAWLPGRFFAMLGQHNRWAFFAMGVSLAIIFIIVLLITYFSTWERLDTVKEKAMQKTNVDDDLSAIEHVDDHAVESLYLEKESFSQRIVHGLKDFISAFRVKSFALHLMIYLLTFTARDIIGSIYVFFVIFAIHSDSITASNLLTFGGLIGIPCNFFWPYIMTKLGPSRLLRVMYYTIAGILAAYAWLYVSPLVGTVSAITLLYVLQIVWSIANSGTGYVPWTVYTFMPDIDEIVTKKRREGLFAGIMTFSRKSTSALAPLLTGIALQAGGFVETAKTQTQHATNTMVWFLVVSVGILLLLALICTLFFHVSKENHEILEGEVARLKNGGLMADVDPKTRAVVENLTGFHYHQLWGNNRWS